MIYPVTTAPENGLEFLVVCLTYHDDGGALLVDPPQFYFTPFYMRDNHPTRSQPAPVTGLQYDKLSAGFSCDNL